MSNRRRPPRLATGPQLGDLSFEEWFEAPIFESEPDERMEQLAASRRAPLRLAGSTALRWSARRQAWQAGTLRDRVNGFLDRWADVEIAGQARLEGMVLPRRWRR